MAFKSMTQYNQERYGGLFRLVNDNDHARVVFLYQSVDDVLIADTHYIKSGEFSGYVHCCGRGCPACAKGIRVQNKLFIPLYNLDDNEIQFWDRTTNFENQLNNDVFNKYPNPSQYVFTITRHGVAGDINTKYEIRATNRYTVETYDQILNKFQIKMPDYYSNICKELSATELSDILNQGNNYSAPNGDSLPDYSVTPRARNTASADPIPPVHTPVPAEEMLPFDDGELAEFSDEADAEVDDVSF